MSYYLCLTTSLHQQQCTGSLSLGASWPCKAGNMVMINADDDNDDFQPAQGPLPPLLATCHMSTLAACSGACLLWQLSS